MYSGPVAAFAYKMLSARRIARSCWWVRRTLSVPRRVDLALAGTGRHRSAQSPWIPTSRTPSAWNASTSSSLPAAHGREHSLEMQLPFVAHLQPGARIVPLVMGHQTRETAFALGDAIAAACRVRDEESGASATDCQFGFVTLRTCDSCVADGRGDRGSR
jgi:hypothetical protein